MPRLLQNSRRGRPLVSRSDRPAASTNHALTELPPYEPPSFPMNEAGKRALMEISSNRDTRKYEQHLAKSIALLKDSVGSTNDRLHSRTGHLEQIVSKRMERGDTEKSELETSIEKSAAKLSEEVIALTRQSEAALREMIDYRAELEDERTVIEQVHGEVNAQKPREPRPQRKPRRREPGDDEDADDLEDKDAVPQGEEEEDTEMGQPEDNTPYTGASEFLETIRRAKTDEYGRLSMHQRYGLNNDYISFKRTLHDAQYPDGVVALPDASNWFGADGRPVVSAADGQGILGRNDTQGEDDLVIAREVLSFRCPLTLTTMKDPYTSRVCKHTFEKEAIMVFIRDNNGHCKCPVCPAEIRKTDLVADDIMLRRIQRAENAARRNVDDTSDVEPDVDGDTSVSFDRSRRVKREKPRGRQAVDQGGDDDEGI